MNRTTTFIAAVAALAVAGFLGFRTPPGGSGDPDPPAAGRDGKSEGSRSPERAGAGRKPVLAPIPVPDMPEPVFSPHPADSPEHAAWVETREDELLELMWNEDRESMLTILTELRNPDPGIRGAAANATREFGSRDAIPVLEKMAAAGLSPEEKKTCLELVEWLKLPTLGEKAAELRALEATTPKPAE